MGEDTVVRLGLPGSSIVDIPLLLVLRDGARRMIEGVKFRNGGPIKDAEDKAAA
jgi:hypothetical protein